MKAAGRSALRRAYAAGNPMRRAAVIRAASGRRRSPPDAAGKQGDALALINGLLGSYEPSGDSSRRLSALCVGRVSFGGAF